MRLAVYSHKPCWRSPGSPTGYATDGGFPMQMEALSELFDETVLVVPCAQGQGRRGEGHLRGHNLSVRPVSYPRGAGLARKLDMGAWMVRNRQAIFGTLRWADAVHAPIPGDIGTIGMLLAWGARKPLFVRHCGNWAVQRTLAERLWRWFMERHAGARNVMMATGGGEQPPSPSFPSVQWIFSTSLTEAELLALHRPRTHPLGGCLKLVTVGRQEAGKGTDTLVRALPAVSSVWPDVSLDVVGGGSQIGGLQRLADEEAVGHRVRFHGAVSHDRVLSILREADLFCFPTRSEGFPKAVLEALACGLPVVTTSVSVLPHLMRGGAGWVMPEATPAAVAQAVLAAVDKPALYVEASNAAFSTARQYTLERWQSVIREALEASWQRPLRKA